MGGALLQGMTRDTMCWAMKCSSVTVNGQEIDVFKDPVTDPGKVSKKGRVSTFRSRLDKNYIIAGRIGQVDSEYVDLMDVVYENGVITRTQTFSEIRENASHGTVRLVR